MSFVNSKVHTQIRMGFRHRITHIRGSLTHGLGVTHEFDYTHEYL
jgi:hypothetical protein